MNRREQILKNLKDCSEEEFEEVKIDYKHSIRPKAILSGDMEYVNDAEWAFKQYKEEQNEKRTKWED